MLSQYIGEDSICEKKESLEQNKIKTWLKTVCAFANTYGGVILFGVNDKDQIIGIQDYKKDSEFISEKIKAHIDPLPNFKLENIVIDSKYVIVLTVEKGFQTPYSVFVNKSREFYIRVGNQTNVADNFQLRKLLLDGLGIYYDGIKSKISRRDASFEFLKASFYEVNGIRINDKDLVSFNLITKDDFLTNAGILFTDQKNNIISRVFCTRWNGLTKSNSKNDSIDNKELEGNLLLLLDFSKQFISNNSKIIWNKTGKARIEYPDYPETAIHEVVVNALAHRDYATFSSEIHIDMFDDRVEISSPGGMFDGSLIQNSNIFNVASNRRNPIIADVFDRLNLMERRGSGFKKIIDSYQIQKNYNEQFKPEFKSSINDFKAILKNLNYVQKNDYKENKILEEDSSLETQKPSLETQKPSLETQKPSLETQKPSLEIANKTVGIGNKKQKISNQEQLIISYAKTVDYFKSKEISILLNIKQTRTKEILGKMINDGLIDAHGEKRHRIYFLKINK